MLPRVVTLPGDRGVAHVIDPMAPTLTVCGADVKEVELQTPDPGDVMLHYTCGRYLGNAYALELLQRELDRNGVDSET